MDGRADWNSEWNLGGGGGAATLERGGGGRGRSDSDAPSRTGEIFFNSIPVLSEI
jgi:hypothetical protein